MRLFFKKIRCYLAEKGEVNYLYFSALLLGLTFFTFSHLLLLEHPILGIQLFFLFYAFGQAFLETSGFILIACILKKWAPRWALWIFIAISFLLLLIHFTHFTMLRLMDISISYPMKFLFGSGIGHFITGVQALNMNMGMMALILLTFFLIPLAGLLFYWGTHHVTKKKPWTLSLHQVTFAALTTGALLLSLDLLAQPYISRKIYKKYQKALPFGTTFLGATPQYATLLHPIASPHLEKPTIAPLTLLSKPNIYFFVIETLRKDFVNEKTAPHLTAFGRENIEIVSSFANANATHLSWFSIFYSGLPLHWTHFRDTWNEGAPSLQILKQLGYTIRVYAAADLHYFGMDQSLFGKDRKLAESIEEFTKLRNIEPCDRDALCLSAFERDLATEKGKEGNVYIFFLDSTHSEYSFPKTFPLVFEPSAKHIDYLTLSAKTVAPLQNRYRNAVAYVDSLMHRFFDRLKQEGLYESAILAITGDHGEEFFEEGALFHGTHLNSYQTEVPIFLKCPGKTSWAKEATHLDIFPSLLHHVTDHTDFQHLFDGTSIFSDHPPTDRFCVMQNSSDPPSELCIHRGMNKLHFRFLSSEEIYHQTEIEILSSQIFEKSFIENYLDSAKGNLEKTTD